MTHYKYPSIEQFRHVYKSIRQYAEKHGLLYPIINFTGTAKLHGVNTAVVQLPDGTRYAQSRNKVITPEDDHMGFAKYVVDHKEDFDCVFNTIDPSHTNTVVLFGNFVGKGIQKNIGVSKLPKTFYLFEYVCNPENNDEALAVLVPLSTSTKELPSVASLYLVRTQIDFSKTLEELTALLTPYTQKVEDRCPVAAHFLPDDDNLIGEGVVWKANLNGEVIRFKVKGDKHSEASRVPKQPFTPEELAIASNYDRVALRLYSPQRCQQAIFEIYGTDWESLIGYKEIGDYLKWVLEDTWKEEYGILEEEKLTTLQVSKRLAKLARTHFIGVFNGSS